MPIPTTVTFRGLDASDSLREEAIGHAQRLERFADDIRDCEVTFRTDTSRWHRPHHLSVQISVSMRGSRIGVKHGDAAGAGDEDVHALLSHAFDTLTRRVEDYVRCRRGDVKTHVHPVT